MTVPFDKCQDTFSDAVYSKIFFFLAILLFFYWYGEDEFWEKGNLEEQKERKIESTKECGSS